MSEIQKKTSGMAIASMVIGIFCLIPFLGVLFSLPAIILGIIAAVAISKNKETLKGLGMAITGIVLGAVSVILIPIVAILAAIAIPNFMMAKTKAQDALARSTISNIATAFETYAVDNGAYPISEDKLLEGSPSYLDQVRNGKTISGYKYMVASDPISFHITAEPETCGVTGTKIMVYDASSGLNERDCRNSQ